MFVGKKEENVKYPDVVLAYGILLDPNAHGQLHLEHEQTVRCSVLRIVRTQLKVDSWSMACAKLAC